MAESPNARSFILTSKNNRLSIGFISPMQFPVNPPFKGGAEATSWYTSLLLAEHGHDVYLFQRGDTGPTHPNIHNIQFDAPTLFSHEHLLAGAITRFAEQQDIDILINISWIPSLPALEAAGYTPPIMHWISLPRHVWEPFDQALFTFESQHIYAQTETHKQQYSKLLTPHELTITVPLPPRTAPSSNVPDKPEPYVVWAGRPEREKGPHIALRAAIDAGIAIRMYFTQETEFYNTHIRELEKQAPHQSEFHFERDIHYLLESLTHAQALLMPNQPFKDSGEPWEEPGSRLAMEALTHGCPIIATPNGCLNEFILPGVNGFFIDYHQTFDISPSLAIAQTLNREDIQTNALALWSDETIYRRLMDAITRTLSS
jgi:glycosyltransferase involved in cell wall biosynthesis